MIGRRLEAMNNKKTTWTNDEAVSVLKETELSSRDVNNNKTMNDRPAIFIEEIKDENQYNSLIKSN